MFFGIRLPPRFALPSLGMKVLGMKGTVSRYEGFRYEASPSRGMKDHRLEV